MSLDIWAECPFCENIVGGDHNYTHNVTPIWQEIGAYDLLYNSDGRTVGEVLPGLIRARNSMEGRMRELSEMDPANGWGSARGAHNWLCDLVANWHEVPASAIVRVIK